MRPTTYMSNEEKAQNSLKVIACDECHNQWLMKETHLQTNPIEVHGEKLEVTYFVCPHCGKLYVVRIDNNETKLLQKQIEVEGKRIIKARKKGEDTTKRVKKVIRATEQHKKLCEALKHKYNGTFYQKSAK